MAKDFQPLSPHGVLAPNANSTDLTLLGEERESFTQVFAYDHFQWPAFKVFGDVRPSVIDVRTPSERAAEERGLEGGGSSAPYTTTNSPIPVYKTGEVVELDGGAAILPQSNQSGPVVGIDDYRADARFQGFDGSGQAIVILDTGIDLDDPFFGPDNDGNGISDRIVYQYDFADNDGNAGDFDGHGSNVASIAASSHGTYTGMAPGADIIALKVFTNAGSGHFGYIENALQWVINNAEAYNIVSVNMSLSDGGNYSSAVTQYGIADELATLAAMDVMVVSASGNGFYELNSVQGVAYPSADPNSLSVGAVYDANTGGWSYGTGAIAYTTAADRITPFSQRDDSLSDIFAPGAAITGAGAGSSLTTMHGTSQAAPHIAGIAALAQQLATEVMGRRLTYEEFSNLLQSSADIIIDGDDENDNVANTGLAFPRVNVAELGEAILELAFPGADTYYSISNLDVVKAEGNQLQTAFTYTITRTGNTSGAATIDYAVTGTGDNPATADDFNPALPLQGTLTFSAGQTSRNLTFLVDHDFDYEGDETFALALSNPSGAGAIIRPNATGTIINDDAPAPGVIATLVNAAFDSGSDGFAFFPGAFGGTTSTTYIAGSWTGDDLIIELGGDPNSGAKVQNITGGWERSFTLLEEMEVTLTFDYEILHSTGMDLKEYAEALYSFDGGPVVVLERIYGNGNGGSDDIIGPVTYEVDLGMLDAGTHSFTLGAYLNNRNYAGEYSNIHFDNVTVEAVVPVPINTFFSVAALNAVRDEGDAGNTDFTFTVTRSGNTTGADTVDYTVSGAGAGTEDFTGGVYPSGTVSFAAGETSKTVTIQVAGDTDYEANEGFTVTLSNASVGATIATASASGTITNDDLLVPGEVIALVDASFADGSDGFAFFPGAFGGTTSTTYIAGSWTGDDLIIELGGDPNSGAKVQNITGGWERSFTLLEEMEVTLTFDYEILHSTGMDLKEYAEALYSFDGGPVVVLERIYGNGNGGSDDIIGPVTYEVDLGMLDAGTHSFTLGAYLNNRNYAGEYSNIHFDNVTVEAVVPVPTGTSPDPLLAATISLDDLLVDGNDVFDPISDLLSGFGGDDSRLDDPAAPDFGDIASAFAAGLSNHVSGLANAGLSEMELLAGTGV